MKRIAIMSMFAMSWFSDTNALAMSPLMMDDGLQYYGYLRHEQRKQAAEEAAASDAASFKLRVITLEEITKKKQDELEMLELSEKLNTKAQEDALTRENELFRRLDQFPEQVFTPDEMKHKNMFEQIKGVLTQPQQSDPQVISAIFLLHEISSLLPKGREGIRKTLGFKSSQLSSLVQDTLREQFRIAITSEPLQERISSRYIYKSVDSDEIAKHKSVGPDKIATLVDYIITPDAIKRSKGGVAKANILLGNLIKIFQLIL